MSSPPSEALGPRSRPAPLDYGQAGDWLLGLELFGMDFGTDRMRRLLARLGDPQSQFAAIHVVGSNGKSSTVRITDAILRAQGTASGAYLSPHLSSWTERVLVGGRPVSGEQFARAASQVAGAVEAEDRSGQGGPVTQFEALTAIAFVLLAGAGVRVAVVEAGLGGRLDATNVIGAPVVACTSVGLEHAAVLGATVAEIAIEKLDVVGPGATLVVPADLAPDALEVAARRASETGARLVVAPRSSPLAPEGTPPYLSHNLALAAAAAHAFLGALDEAAVSRAIEAGALEIDGRFQPVGESPLTIFDGAHNPDGTVALAGAIDAAALPKPVVACMAVLDDKDAAGMIEALRPQVDRFVFTSCSHPRSLSAAELARAAGEAGFETVDGAHEALARARSLAGPDGTAIATGSLYLLAELGREPGSGPGATL